MKNSLPVRVVTLDDFYMDATEAANAQYQQFFVEQTGHRKPSYWTDNRYKPTQSTGNDRYEE